MSATSVENKHQCSCGRTFRHEISLKRHQKVSGCVVAEVELEVASLAQELKVGDQQAVRLAAEDMNACFRPITAHQIALWQEQKNIDLADYEPEAKQTIWQRIDWLQVQTVSLEFAAFSCQKFSSLAKFLGYTTQLVARCTLFGAFLIGLGWLCILGLSSGLSATPASASERSALSELSARSTVTSFLQTAALGQYDRAYDYLADEVKSSISAQDIAKTIKSLSLSSAPQKISSKITSNGQLAKVTISRGDTSEIYTLAKEERGWGLTSVAIHHF